MGRTKIITDYLRHLAILLGQGLKRNVFRIHGVGGAHRMREGAVVANWNRSESFRRRYRGRHFLRIWEPTWTRCNN